ncbi:MAG: hypothetical protein KC503_18980 [Myxococcales bacterium]|nr:hypothetical protein [Myxococcales bacterium]
MNVNSTSVASSISNFMATTGGANSTELALMYVQLLQIDESRAKLNSLVTRLEQNSNLQKSLRARMDKLNTLKGLINAHGDGEGASKHMSLAELAIRLYAPQEKVQEFEQSGGLKGLNFLTQASGPMSASSSKAAGWKQEINGWMAQLNADYPTTRDTFSLDNKGMVDVAGGKDMKFNGHSKYGDYELNAATLSEYITELKGQSEELGAETNQLNLFTQSALNAVERGNSFTSNLLKTTHKVSMDAIRNIA